MMVLNRSSWMPLQDSISLTLGIREFSVRPELGEWNGKYPRVGGRQRTRTCVKNDARLKVFSCDVGETTKAVAVGRHHCRARLDLDAPDVPAATDNHIHLDLILVAIVPESQLRIGPAGLRHELLQDERFENVAEAIPFGVPLVAGEAGQRGRDTAVDDMNLRCLDEPTRVVRVPGRYSADQKQALQRGEMVLDRMRPDCYCKAVYLSISSVANCLDRGIGGGREVGAAAVRVFG